MRGAHSCGNGDGNDHDRRERESETDGWESLLQSRSLHETGDAETGGVPVDGGNETGLNLFHVQLLSPQLSLLIPFRL